MSDNTDTAEAPKVDEAQAPENPNAEAAKYRHRAKEAEAQRDALAEQLTALRRAAVEDRLKAQHVPPAGFWASGVQLDDLLDDDGNLDEKAIKTAADHAVETLGLERVGVHMKPVPSEGHTTTPGGSQSWESAFAPK